MAIFSAISSLIGGNQQANAVKDASADASTLNRYIYDTTRSDYAPYRQVGQNALYELSSLMGLGGAPAATTTTTTTQPATNTGSNTWGSASGIQDQISKLQSQLLLTKNAGDYSALSRQIQALQAQAAAQSTSSGTAAQTSGTTTNTPAKTNSQIQSDAFSRFVASPDYQFRLSEGTKALDRSAAARGLLLSGAQAKALTDYGQNMASTEYGNYFNRMASLAGVGQSATGGTATAGSQYAANQTNNLLSTGQQRASIYGNTWNNIGNAFSSAAGLGLAFL